MDLRATARAAGGPGKPLAVRGRHRESVETFGVSDAHWLLHSRSIDDEQLEVREPELVGREEDVVARWMLVRRPAHRTEVGDALHVGAVGLHGVDVRNRAALVEAPPDDARTVVRE